KKKEKKMENGKWKGNGKEDGGQRKRDLALTTSPVPTPQALKTVHVNLVELVDAIRAGRRVRRFRNVAELKAYTGGSKNRVFPRDVAKEDGFVNVLLRVLS
ncbi:hypothetical protein LTR66_013084, partial [Elasticomyces elasticus]